MRCKTHRYETGGSGGGVCAPCLRDRLLALAAAQNEASSLPLPRPPASPPEPAAPAVFPRSVSPYVGRRKSDAPGACRHHPSLLFFRTPQVGPAAGGGGLEDGDIGFGGGFERRRSGKFSVLATLFGHHHHRSGEKNVKERKQRSWLAGIMPRGRRDRRKAGDTDLLPPSAAATTATEAERPRRSCRVMNRGLSPERDVDGSSEESSSPMESPWRPTPSPMRKPPGRRRHGGAGASGFAVCLSPLVRPSPGRRHHHGQTPDAAFSGELRPSPLHRLSSGGSPLHCRSRKLADASRFR